MQTKNPGSEVNWVDPDDAPPLTREWLQAAELSVGAKVLRPAKAGGRPKLDNPKQAVNLRLDADVLEKFRASGPGWQTRINDALRVAAGLNSGSR